MLRPVDKFLLLLTLSIAIFYYLRKWIITYKISKYKINASKKERLIFEALEGQGYTIVNISCAKKIVYYKDNNPNVHFLERKLVVKNAGKKYLVESFPKSQTISLRDSVVKLKILTNIACYNINGVLFINSKGEAIKEFSIRVVGENIVLAMLKKLIILCFFTVLGFYLSHIFL